MLKRKPATEGVISERSERSSTVLSPPVYYHRTDTMMSLKRMPRDKKVVEVHEEIPKMVDIIREKVFVLEASHRDDTFFIVDLQEIYGRLEQWKRLMPRVEPFYALKCNSDPGITRFIADLGIGFDCASQREIQQVLNLGVHPSRIVYANPCKPSTHIQYATDHNVNLMTFDDVLELQKIKKHNPDAQLILRIFSSKEFKAVHNFNKKFGCHPKEARYLLMKAINLGLNVVGVSFHVGSQPEEVACFASTIEDARNVFDQALELGLDLKLLDIGGGYPGEDTHSINFHQVAKAVTTALDIHFPSSSGVRLIAEPGRYFVTSAFTLVVNVIAKRIVDRNEEQIGMGTQYSQKAKGRDDDIDESDDEVSKLHMYYVNDGIYGAFNNVFTDHAEVYPMLLSAPNQSRRFWSCVWGPTCDGLDLIIPDCFLPEMEVGQWIYFRNMGAYTISLSCDFNGISRPCFYYVCSEKIWQQVYGKYPAEPLPQCQTGMISQNTDLDFQGISSVNDERSYRLSLSKGE